MAAPAATGGDRTGAVDPEAGGKSRRGAHGGHFGGSWHASRSACLRPRKNLSMCWNIKRIGVKELTELTAKGVVLSKPQHAAQSRSTCILRLSPVALLHGGLQET